MKMRNLVILTLASTLLLACQKKKHDQVAPGGVAVAGIGTVVSARYFDGGFLAAPGDANFNHDFTVTLTAPQNGGYLVNSRDPDPACVRGQDFIAPADVQDMFLLITDLQLAVAPGPYVADDGVEFVELTLNTGAKRLYYLNANAPIGTTYALNGDDLSDYLQDLDGDIPVACKAQPAI